MSSLNINNLESVYNYIITTISSKDFRNPIKDYIDENCQIFFDVTENTFQQGALFNEFTQLVDNLLDKFIKSKGITDEMFLLSAKKGIENPNKPRDKKYFEQLMAFNNYNYFKNMMTKRNYQILKLIEEEMIKKGEEKKVFENKEQKKQFNDEEVKQAIQMSLEEQDQARRLKAIEEEDLKRAIKKSLKEGKKNKNVQKEIHEKIIDSSVAPNVSYDAKKNKNDYVINNNNLNFIGNNNNNKKNNNFSVEKGEINIDGNKPVFGNIKPLNLINNNNDFQIISNKNPDKKSEFKLNKDFENLNFNNNNNNNNNNFQINNNPYDSNQKIYTNTNLSDNPSNNTNLSSNNSNSSNYNLINNNSDNSSNNIKYPSMNSKLNNNNNNNNYDNNIISNQPQGNLNNFDSNTNVYVPMSNMLNKKGKISLNPINKSKLLQKQSQNKIQQQQPEKKEEEEPKQPINVNNIPSAKEPEVKKSIPDQTKNIPLSQSKNVQSKITPTPKETYDNSTPFDDLIDDDDNDENEFKTNVDHTYSANVNFKLSDMNPNIDMKMKESAGSIIKNNIQMDKEKQEKMKKIREEILKKKKQERANEIADDLFDI